MMCCYIEHESRRRLVPSDNSPAQWIVRQLFSGASATIDYLNSELMNIPATQRMGALDKAESHFKVTLDEIKSGRAGTQGWYLAHLKSVGLGRIKSLQTHPMEGANGLKSHFIKFMSPSNMCLISKDVAAIAEMKFFFDEA